MEQEKPSARKKGAGTLQLRGNKYLAIWRVNGKRYTRSTGTGDLAQAEKKLAEFVKPFQEKTELEIVENLAAKVRVQETKIKDTRDKKRPAVRIKFLVDVFKADLSTSAITAGTEENYNVVVNVFERETGLEYAYEVDDEVAKKFMTKIKSSNGPGTYNRYLNCLKALFRCAMAVDYRIRTNPFEGFMSLKMSKGEGRRELTNDEVKLLIEKAYSLSKDIGILFTLGALTGMRKIDICYLKWSSCDVENSLIRYLPIKTKKNGIYAVVKMHENVKIEIANAKKIDETYVFPELKRLYDTTEVNAMISKVFDECKIARHEVVNGRMKIVTGFHALRVYFATWCGRNGMPINQIMKMLGHSKPDMSLHYVDTQVADITLPDFDGSETKVVMKKTTFEAIEKARGSTNIDDFLMALLEGGKCDAGSLQKWRESKELDKMLDEVMS